MSKNNLNKTDRRIAISMTTFAAVIASAMPAFANSALDTLSTTIQDYFGPIRAIVMGAAGLCAVIALGLWMVAPSDRAAEAGKRWFFRLLIGIALLFCLGAIFSFFSDLGSGSGLDISDVMGN